MHNESFIRILAGTMILISLGLAHLLGPVWLWLTAFVGVNLIQSALTGFCPPTWLLRRLQWVDPSGRIHWGGQRSADRS